MHNRTSAVIAEMSEMIYDANVPRENRKDLAREVGQALGVATELESLGCTEEDRRMSLTSELEAHLTRAQAIAQGKKVAASPPRIDSYRVTISVN